MLEFSLMPALNAHSRLRAIPEQVSSELGKEVVILHLKNGVYYGLDEVGVVIWRKLQTGSSVADIVSSITAEFEVDAEQCENDVLKVLSEMLEAQLVIVES